MAQPDQALMGAPSAAHPKAVMELAGGAAARAAFAKEFPQIVEVDHDGADLSPPAPAPAPAPAAADDDEPSLAELMMNDALEDKARRAEVRTKETVRMKKSFGDGMKKGLKKGFFDKPDKRSTRKPKPPPPPEPQGPIDVRANPKQPSELMETMKQEVADNMERHPLAKALEGGEWATPELIQEMARRPVLARGMSNPRYQAALQELQKDPKNGAKKFDNDPELKRFLTEFCEVMGSHFVKLGGGEAVPPSTPPLPTAEEKRQMGPLAAEVAEAAARGEGPEPAKTQKEQEEVDKIVQNEELRDLLMNPKTQQLMQRCADPRQFQEAMRNPENRMIIKKLSDAGLVKMER